MSKTHITIAGELECAGDGCRVYELEQPKCHAPDWEMNAEDIERRIANLERRMDALEAVGADTCELGHRADRRSDCPYWKEGLCSCLEVE